MLKIGNFDPSETSSKECRVVFIPIELKNREFHPHLLLASKLANLGMTVLIGSHAAIYQYLNLKKTKAGIYLDKGTQILEKTQGISKKVNAMFILDQELSPIQNNLGIYKERNVVKERFYSGTENYVDGFFTVGPKISELAEEVLRPEIIHEFGWPRIELLVDHSKTLYSSEIDEITDKNGDFLLFVSSFSLISNFQRLQTLAPLYKLGWITDSFDEKWWGLQFDHLKMFLKTLIKWRELGFTKRIVIRPHLYEDPQAWKELVQDIPNVFVEQKGEIYPWLHAANAILHRGSTVSLQSALIEKQTFVLSKCTPIEFSATINFSIPVDENNPPFESRIEAQEKNSKSLFNQFLLYHSDERPTDKIAQLFGTTDIKQELVLSSVRLVLGCILSYQSWLRGLGLLKDEIRRIFKLDVGTTQFQAIPRGIRANEARVFLYKIRKGAHSALTVKQMTINLIRISPK